MILLGRPVNNLIAGVTVVVAGFLLRDIPDAATLVFASLGAALIAGFGNAINDCFDIAADRLNKPGRLIASGKLTVRQGYASAFIHVILGLASAALVNVSCLLIAATAALLLYAYSAYGKRLLFLSNIWVASVSALTFLYAAAAGNNWEWRQIRLALLGAFFGFLFHLGREMIKDAEDVSGDSSVGTMTLATKYGPESCMKSAMIPFAVLTAVMFAAYLFLGLSVIYLISSILFVSAMTIISVDAIRTESVILASSRLQLRLKLLMPAGLLTLLIARFTV
jgi:4-hydroxybenzoate polyprenyltransferase